MRSLAAGRTTAIAAKQEAERDKQAAQAAYVQAQRAQIDKEKALAETRRNRWQQEQFAQAAQQSPALRAAVAQVEQSIQSKSLVYLQYAGAEQGGMMARLRNQLGKRGYSAPGAEKVGVTPLTLRVALLPQGRRERRARTGRCAQDLGLEPHGRSLRARL